MKKLIMLSRGEYSDYRVDGLYEVDADLGLDYKMLLSLRLEYAYSLGLDVQEVAKLYSLDDYDLEEMHKEFVVGRKRPNWSDGRSDTYHERLNAFNSEYKSKITKPVCFIDWLVETGVLTPVEYEEIHEDD